MTQKPTTSPTRPPGGTEPPQVAPVSRYPITEHLRQLELPFIEFEIKPELLADLVRRIEESGDE